MDQSSSPSHRHLSNASLGRFGSAPGSFLSTLVDSVVATSGEISATTQLTPPARSFFFAGVDSPCLTSESTCKAAELNPSYTNHRTSKGAASGLDIGLDRPYSHVNGVAVADLAEDDGEGGGGRSRGGESTALFRHSSSPAGFLSHIMVDGGFSVSRGGGVYSRTGTEGFHGTPSRRLKSQLSFSSRQDSFSHISEMGIPEEGEGRRSDELSAHPYAASSFQISSWDEPNSIVFSTTSGKRGRGGNGDIGAALSNMDSPTALELANVENLFQIQKDSVPCKIRAKRGCATHPRSIAERERRTRISDKLKKLQELVPNMDKQTSTSDMLDLAVQHIKGLRSQVQCTVPTTQKIKYQILSCRGCIR